MVLGSTCLTPFYPRLPNARVLEMDTQLFDAPDTTDISSYGGSWPWRSMDDTGSWHGGHYKRDVVASGF